MKTKESRSKSLRNLPRNIWAVSITSFLTDVSSEMVINLLPLYLFNVLGVSTAVIGLIEGVADAIARSFRMNSSGIPLEHPLVQNGISLNMSHYGSPTTSDQAIMKGFPTLKLGPGDSARSHTADEFIYVKEIGDGIEKYYNLLNGLIL